MKYLNSVVMEDLVMTGDFLNRQPFPWLNPHGILTADGYEALIHNAPEIGMFRKTFSVERKHGQKPHDRWEFVYGRDEGELPRVWQEFINELKSREYRSFIKRLFQADDFDFRFQWQYSTQGCSVSPHCDGPRKLGVHIFYINAPGEWEEEWGGQTLVLDDEGKFPPESAPKLEDFVNSIPTKTLGNHSLIFERTDRSWHGVKPLGGPEGKIRKIFSIAIDKEKTTGVTKVKNAVYRILKKIKLR